MPKIRSVCLLAFALLVAHSPTHTPAGAQRAEPAGPLSQRELASEYAAARQDYSEGRTGAAHDRLAQAAARGPRSTTIDYALGTAAARLGRNGEALAHLERALIHAPRDSNARHNWRHIQSELPADARADQAYPQRWHSFASPFEWFVIAAFAYIAGWGMLAIGTLNRGPDRQPGMIRGGIALVLASLPLTALFLLARHHALDGAYVSSDAPVRVLSGPGPSFRVIQELPPAARVRLDSKSIDSGHRPIRLQDGAVGYVQAGQLAIVAE